MNLYTLQAFRDELEKISMMKLADLARMSPEDVERMYGSLSHRQDVIQTRGNQMQEQLRLRAIHKAQEMGHEVPEWATPHPASAPVAPAGAGGGTGVLPAPTAAHPNAGPTGTAQFAMSPQQPIQLAGGTPPVSKSTETVASRPSRQSQQQSQVAQAPAHVEHTAVGDPQKHLATQIRPDPESRVATQIRPDPQSRVATQIQRPPAAAAQAPTGLPPAKGPNMGALRPNAMANVQAERVPMRRGAATGAAKVEQAAAQGAAHAPANVAGKVLKGGVGKYLGAAALGAGGLMAANSYMNRRRQQQMMQPMY